MPYILTSNPWYGVILWIILYTSDYYLTLYSARGYREIGHFKFEGSFESFAPAAVHVGGPFGDAPRRTPPRA